MAIVASDLVAYGSASMPDDDTPTGIGGAIALTKRVVFTDISANDEVEALSSNAGDTTQTITFYGRDAAGNIVSEAETLNGVTPVVTAQVFASILKITLSAAAVGTVTVRKESDDVTIATFAPGETEIRRPFYDASAEASGGATRTYYEKIFLKNNHGSLALTAATVAETADPSTNVAFALEASLDGTDTNGAGARQTHTGGYTFNSTTKNVANSQSLTAEAAQGVWLQLTLADGEAALNTSFTMQLAGNTAA